MEYPHTADMQPQKPKSLLKEKKKKKAWTFVRYC